MRVDEHCSCGARFTLDGVGTTERVRESCAEWRRQHRHDTHRDDHGGPPVDLNPALIERSFEQTERPTSELGFRGSRSSGGLRRRDAATGRFITPRTDESEATT